MQFPFHTVQGSLLSPCPLPNGNTLLLSLAFLSHPSAAFRAARVGFIYGVMAAFLNWGVKRKADGRSEVFPSVFYPGFSLLLLLRLRQLENTRYKVRGLCVRALSSEQSDKFQALKGRG